MILCDRRSMNSMTRKLSISLPDDVAAILDEQENASAYIAEAIRRRRNEESVDSMLKRHGIHVTQEGVARMRARLATRAAAKQAEIETGQRR